MNATSCLTTETENTEAEEELALPLLSLDIGMKRIGVAVCDGLGLFCRGVSCLSRTDSGWVTQASKLAAQYNCRGIIVGLPRNMDGSEGVQAEDCRNAAKQLAKATELPIRLWDERLSSWSAAERLRGQGLNEKRVKERLDQTAAAIILEEYLRAVKRRRALAAAELAGGE